jgi:hypothetical protein
VLSHLEMSKKWSIYYIGRLLVEHFALQMNGDGGLIKQAIQETTPLYFLSEN